MGEAMKTKPSANSVLVALLLALPAFGQEPQGRTDQPLGLFGERIEVRVVNVEVVVTDRQGNRVPDLAVQDFRLRVDGQDVPIEFFTEVRGGQAIAPTEAPGAAIKGLPALAPGSPVGTSYLVFVDDFFSLEARRNDVLESLKDELGRLGPEDRMAIVAYDGRTLDMLSSWSNSERALSRALNEAIGRRSDGVARLAEQRTFDTSRRLATGSFGPRTAFASRLDLEELSYAERLGQQVERVVEAAALRGFASPPGRKVMLVLSGGWPFSPADFVVNNSSRPVLNQDVPRGEEIFRPLVDTANRLGYTLYTVDVPGLETEAASAERTDFTQPGINQREQEVQASLLYVSEQTGGQAMLNSVREQVLARAEADTRSYYWLGFTPSWKGDDERHRIDVDVTRPGLRVRSRDGFLDLSRKAEVSMMVESAMLFGNAAGAQSMPIEVGAAQGKERKTMQLPVSLAIPVDAVTFVPLGGKHAAELELRIAAIDEKGDRSDIPVIPLALSTEKAPPPGAYIPYKTTLTLRRLAHHLILAVYDPLSGNILTAEADVAPPAKK
jgi:VWFA-related protein